MSAAPPSLSVPASRVVASASRVALPVTMVFVGHPEVVHGKVSFAHGARVVVRPTAPGGPVRSDWSGRRLVMTLLIDGRAHALQGQVREVAERGVSIDLAGELLGADPRRHPRTVQEAGAQLTVGFGEHIVHADIVDTSEKGVGLRLPAGSPLPVVDGPLNLIGSTAEGVVARVRHCTMGPGDRPRAVVGVAMSAGSLAALVDIGSQPRV